MKILFILIMMLPVFGFSQTKSDIFKSNQPLVFLGADFSQIQFTKSEKFNNKPEILRFFVDCNNLLEEKTYQKPLKKKLNRREIKNDFSYVTKNNALVNWDKVFSDSTEYKLTDDDITDMIKKLNINQTEYKNYLGMILCEENYSKTKLRGTVAVVFFGINDLKPILIKHFSFKPAGYGFLYYWNSINYNAIRSLKKIKKEVK
jgi:hypothetical protein